MKKVKLFEQFIEEATTSWGKMMKGVKAGNGGPWSIVAIQDRKVVGQSNDIKIQDLIPAKYEALKAEFPKAKLHIEDGGGQVVWNESYINEANSIQKDLASKIHNTIEGDEANKKTILNAMHRTQNQFNPLTVNIVTGYEGSAGMDNRLDRLRTLSPAKLNLILKELNTILGVKESVTNEALAAASQDKLTNHDTLTAKVNATLISNARNGVLKKMTEPGGKTHYWNPETKEYVAKTVTYNGKGEYLYSDALDADGNLTESFMNEAKSSNREEIMDLMETKYKIRSVRPSEDFNGQTEGIWIAADNDEELSGNKIFDYYNRNAKYSNGVLTQLRTAIEKKGWWFEWNDPGTIMIWPKN